MIFGPKSNKAPRRKQRGINYALQSAGFQPAFAPRDGELNPQRLNLSPTVSNVAEQDLLKSINDLLLS
jgi:hypothetical protein